MKFLKKKYLFAAVFAVPMLFSSCERNSTNDKDDNKGTDTHLVQPQNHIDSAQVMDSVDRENKQTLSKADSTKAADSAARHTNPIRDFN